MCKMLRRWQCMLCYLLLFCFVTTSSSSFNTTISSSSRSSSSNSSGEVNKVRAPSALHALVDTLDTHLNETARKLFSSAKVERYLVYQPQFGLCNQLRALHHAIAIAKVLGRILVIPDIVDNDGHGPIYKRDILFDSELITKALTGVLKHDGTSIGCITQETYNKLVSEDKAYLPSKILDLHIQFKQLSPSNIYFENLGWKLPRVVATSLSGYKEEHWVAWDKADVEKVHNEDTLAMATTFGAWMGASNQQDRVWHSAVEQLVYQESKWIAEFVRKITETHAILKDGFMCAHVRRGNFKRACERYDAEYHSDSSRPWVKSFAETGLACYVDEHTFIDQVDEIKRVASERYKRDLPILLVTNDERFADQVRAAEPGYNILQTFQVTEMTGIFQPAIPVIEMTLCSKARIIVANQYSTYSRAIFKKAVWKRKHMTKLSFAWSKSLQNMTYYVDSWQAAGPYVNEHHWV